MTISGVEAAPEPGASPAQGEGRRLLDRRAVAVAAVVALGLCAAVGFVVGADVTERRHELGGWHTGSTHVGSRVVTIEYDGWSYGARDSVPVWIDRSGTLHDSGWPECLRVPPGTDVNVRFAAHEVTVDGMTWRPIMAIDCRGG